MRIRENLGGLVAATSRSSIPPTIKAQIGKVFGVITTKNTPTKELFEKYGGFSGVGTIFYQDYEQSKNTDEADLNFCKTAKPFHTSTQHYPLIGELVLLTDAPSPDSQINNTSNQNELKFVKLNAFIMIGIGIFIFLSGFIGCCGSVKENKCLIGFVI